MQDLTSSRRFLANFRDGAESLYDQVMGQQFALPAPFVDGSLNLSRYEIQGSYFSNSWTITFTNAPGPTDINRGSEVAKSIGCAIAIWTGAAKTLETITKPMPSLNGTNNFTTAEMFAEARNLMQDPELCCACERGQKIIGEQEKKAERITAYRSTHPRRHLVYH